MKTLDLLFVVKLYSYNNYTEQANILGVNVHLLLCVCVCSPPIKRKIDHFMLFFLFVMCHIFIYQ